VAQEKSNIKDLPYNLKKIDEVKEKSIFKKEFIDSVILMSKYFVIKKNLAISSLMPNIFMEEYDKISKNVESQKSTLDSKNLKIEKLLLQTNLNDRISFYKTLIRTSFAEKKSIFIILPTEKDIKNFHESLSKGIEKFSFIIHGGLTKKQQLKKIEDILKSPHPVLVFSTAPYLSIPREDFGTIILEHENSNAYKTIQKPHLDLRTFAEIFAFKKDKS
jgi:primosomal protein N'